MFESFTIDSISEGNKPTISKPSYNQKQILREHESVVNLAKDLKLLKHPNGGYFNETDRTSDSSLIHFLMTCESPVGKFHKNTNSRSIHILQKGKGVYILVHPNGEIKSFKVGFDVSKGEVTQWVVPPNVYKGCYLIPDGNDEADESSSDCLLVSEIVVPGFQFDDMKFITKKEMSDITNSDFAESIEWLL